MGEIGYVGTVVAYAASIMHAADGSPTRLLRRVVRCAAVLACLLMTSGSCLPSSATAEPGDFVPGVGERSGLVDVGQGRKIYLECRGAGSPTVIFLSGAGVAADNWSYTGDPIDQTAIVTRTESAVYPSVATFTRVCAYDRPGTEQLGGAASRSTPVPQPTTTQSAATDLDSLLDAGQVPGPYVLFGHSWGGLIAQTYARTYPQTSPVWYSWIPARSTCRRCFRQTYGIGGWRACSSMAERISASRRQTTRTASFS